MRLSKLRTLETVIGATIALSVFAPACWAGHGITEHASTGPGDTNGANDAFFEGISEDGSRARASDLSEYTGELRTRIQVRLTDRLGGVPQTTQHLPLAFDVPCVPTADTLDKSLCPLITSIDSLVPGAVSELTRAIWALDQVRVYDGGPDENGTTTADNYLFAVQGVFVP
jgi:hypothetical protein